MKTPMPAVLAAVALSLTATVATSTLAEPAPGQGQTRVQGGGLKKLADYLNLTDTQKAQIKPIMQSTAQQAKAIKADTSLTPAAKKAKLQELRRTAWQQVLPILTPDQRTKLKALRQHREGAAGPNA